MAETFYFKLFLFMFFLLPVSGSGELNIYYPEVSCVFRQSCMLPCRIQLGSDPLIHWYQESAGDVVVHSYYDGRDQLGYQNQNFQNRTSLFQDQISRGNASLLLKEVKIQDEGRYKCYTSIRAGYKQLFINLKTEAPVSTIRIHQDGNRITCSSEGIYPQPELTWSTEPPSNTTLNESTRIQKTEDQLYDISSSLTVPDGSDRIYSCTIRTRSNNKTLILNDDMAEKSVLKTLLVLVLVLVLVPLLAVTEAGESKYSASYSDVNINMIMIMNMNMNMIIVCCVFLNKH
uniref:Ig-like domain-containing protein n=1 Tax=Xiphophorus couchianus TaxID=32473 RepID=A0A3B5MI45_9TELE